MDGEFKYVSLAVSGLPGSGKSTLLERLSVLTGWQIKSMGDYFREEFYKQTGNQDDKEFALWWKELAERDPQRIMDVNRQAKEEVEKGDILFDSRYTFYLDETVASLFLTAPLITRSYRALMSERHAGKDIVEISEILQQREQSEREIGKRLHQDMTGISGFDYTNSQEYALTLNPGFLSIDEEVRIVMQLLKEKA